MTEYEFVSLISDLRTESAIHAMNFFAIWSAFIIVVYFVGNRISKIYSIFLAVLYTFFAIAPATTFFGVLRNIYSTIDRYHLAFPDTAYVQSVGVPITNILLFVYIFAWLVSIAFLIHTRKKGNDKSGIA